MARSSRGPSQGRFRWRASAEALVLPLVLAGCSSGTSSPRGSAPSAGFTTGTDALSSTDGSITYNATLGGSAPTLTPGDSLHGAGNTLALTDDSSAASPDLLPAGLVLSGVPRITLDTAGNAGVDAGHPFDLSAFTGVTRFDLVAAGNQGDFLAAHPGLALTVRTASPAVSVAGGFASLTLEDSALASLSLAGTGGAVSLDGPSSLTVQASGLALTGGLSDANGHLASLVLAGSGGASSLDTVQGSALASLTATGNVALGSPSALAALPASLTTLDLSGDSAACCVKTQGSGAAVTLGSGDNILLCAGTASDTITVGNGNNHITDQSGGNGGTITTGTGTNTLDLGGHGNTVLRLGTDAAFGSDPTVPNVVILNAAAGVTIRFRSTTSLVQYVLTAFSAPDVVTLLQNMETLLQGNPRSAAAQTFGGNTYIVESATGVLGPTDTVIVKIVGVHIINIIGAQIVLSS